MTQSETHNAHPSARDVAVIVGGGPGISASCARLFAQNGMRVGIAARNPDKPVLENLERTHGVRRYACDATEPAAVEMAFQDIVRDLGAPTLVVHNIDGRVPEHGGARHGRARFLGACGLFARCLHRRTPPAAR